MAYVLVLIAVVLPIQAHRSLVRTRIHDSIDIHDNVTVTHDSHNSTVHDGSAKNQVHLGTKQGLQNSTVELHTKQTPSFRTFYEGHSSGRGIWKWSNALDAYQEHFGPMIGQSLKLAEVGVQSGGSIDMWQAVLGQRCRVYGIDINPKVSKFRDYRTTITIGDQGKERMWERFFKGVTPDLDILVDDGGHEAVQMGVTLHNVFPHLSPGGYVAIEDIHGRKYVESFFFPSAKSIDSWHNQSLVDSVHLYPFVLLVKKSGTKKGNLVPPPPPPASVTVSDFPELFAALDKWPGHTIALKNKDWGSFLTEFRLRLIFQNFGPLHDYSLWDVPAGCSTTGDAVCTAQITNSIQQAQITGVSIYPTQILVHVAAQAPYIQAVRMGTDWLPY